MASPKQGEVLAQGDWVLRAPLGCYAKSAIREGRGIGRKIAAMPHQADQAPRARVPTADSREVRNLGMEGFRCDKEGLQGAKGRCRRGPGRQHPHGGKAVQHGSPRDASPEATSPYQKGPTGHRVRHRLRPHSLAEKDPTE